MDKLEEYKRRYLEESRAPGGTLSEETKKLGDEILFDYFKGDVVAMDAFIVSINSDETAVTLEDLQAAMVELTNMILGG